MRCERCGEETSMRLPKPGGGFLEVPRACKCVRDEQALQDKRDKALETVSRANKAFLAPGIQRRMTFESDDGKYPSEAMAYCKRYAKVMQGVDFGLLLFGPPDSGKTFMSCCIANAAIDNGMSVIMRSVPWVIRNLDERSSRREVERGMIACDLLILDDLGAERDTSYAQELLYSVIDARYMRRKKLLVSTNLTKQELAKPADMQSRRIYNRVLEMCLPIQVDTGRKRSNRERYDRMKKELGIS